MLRELDLRGSGWQEAIAWILLSVSFAAYLIVFWQKLPNNQMMAADYSPHMPSLQVGCYHFLRNGLWSTPWFSPAQCGGVPYIADLNVAYYSLPSG